MNWRKVPVIPTVVVIAAVAIMVMLGFWQLDRLDQKEAMIARFAEAGDRPALDPIPHSSDPEDYLYRKATFTCSAIVGWRAIAGRNANDQPGYVHVADCQPDGLGAAMPRVEVVTGWSRQVERPDWEGGEVSGTLTRSVSGGWRLVADPPLGGLDSNAIPDPGDLPNNHLAYAGQWFFFALTALVIYVLALRGRRRSP